MRKDEMRSVKQREINKYSEEIAGGRQLLQSEWDSAYLFLNIQLCVKSNYEEEKGNEKGRHQLQIKEIKLKGNNMEVN